MNKKWLKIVFVVLAVLSLTACSLQNNGNANSANGAQSILERFNGSKTFDEIMEELKEIDYYLVPDFNGLTKKTEKNEENATEIDYYYDGDKLVYADYIGYGEDAFSYYYTSESGDEIEVLYVDSDGKRESLDVLSADFSVYISELNKDAKYGADYLTVSINGKEARELPDTLIYSVEENNTFISAAYYNDKDGYHYYTAYPDENGKPDESDDVIYKKEDKISPFEKLWEFAQDPRVKDIELLIGNGSYSYTENENNEKTWYYHGSAFVLFSDNQAALDFAKENGFEVREEETDEGPWIVEIPDSYFEFSDSYEDLISFITAEVNDYYYRSVIADKDGKIQSLESGHLSYY